MAVCHSQDSSQADLNFEFFRRQKARVKIPAEQDDF
jgi:hypothetical protein